MGIKVEHLTREQIQQEDLSQTAIVITGTRVDIPNGNTTIRIIVGGFPDRDTAYYFCRDNNVRRMVREGKVPGSTIQVEVKLLKLKKALKDLTGNLEYWKCSW